MSPDDAAPAKPCCAPLELGGWCLREPGHDGKCEGVGPMYGPRAPDPKTRKPKEGA